MTTTITLAMPDDCHLHLRDNEHLALTVPHAAERNARAVIMPNLNPPIFSPLEAQDYAERIKAHVPEGSSFQPVMTLYLSDSLTPHMIEKAKQAGIRAIKYYPKHGTTNAEWSVRQLTAKDDILASMLEHDMLLLCHGEVNHDHIDVFDREAAFLEEVMQPIQEKFPGLRVVLEHITTAQAVDFIRQSPSTTGATITAHHCWLNRNDMLGHGINPHYYCMPILKRRDDQEALIEAATSGEAQFFMGTDSAPHTVDKKLNACGCAGIYTGHASLELYAEIFERENALDKLASFCSKHGADFYGLPQNQATITLIKQAWQVPDAYDIEGVGKVIPFMAGQTLQWQIAQDSSE